MDCMYNIRPDVVSRSHRTVSACSFPESLDELVLKPNIILLSELINKALKATDGMNMFGLYSNEPMAIAPLILKALQSLNGRANNSHVLAFLTKRRSEMSSLMSFENLEAMDEVLVRWATDDTDWNVRRRFPMLADYMKKLGNAVAARGNIYQALSRVQELE